MAEINDELWQKLESIIPHEEGLRGGRPRTGDRQVLNGILWVLIEGEQWSHLPKKYGAYVTCWRRFREWEADGTWTKLWLEILGQMERREKLDWFLAFLDGKFVPGKRGVGKQRLG